MGVWRVWPWLALGLLLGCFADGVAQASRIFTRADTLRGSFTTPGRGWWDVAFYDLHVAIHPADSSVTGYNGITYRVLAPAREMQIDLMVPLEVDSMVQDGRAVRFRREGNACFAALTARQRAGDRKTITVYYHGKPQPAKRPPWQGGFTWTADSLGRPWIVTTDQGMGASVWWPNKDTQADEPDSQRVALTVPDPMIDVSNGRLRRVTHHPDGTTAHEWFGNNITAKDNADMWVHESFANYAEGLYTECLFGKEAGADYTIGTRRGIRNDRPIIPSYGVNDQGSGDMYPKGGNMLHTIRQIVGDDEKWRGILRGLNQTFWHQTVMGKQVEEYISAHAGSNLTKVVDQYPRTTQVPVLEYTSAEATLSYRWTDVVPGFAMPLKVTLSPDSFSVVQPTEAWQTVTLQLATPAAFKVDPNYYVIARSVTVGSRDQ